MLAAGSTRPSLAPVHSLSIRVEDTPGQDGIVQGSARFRHSAFDPVVVRWFAGMLATAYRSLAAAGPDEEIGELALFDAGQLRQLAELGGLGRPLLTGSRGGSGSW